MSGPQDKDLPQSKKSVPIPPEGSLLLLALGAKGLKAWRLAKEQNRHE